LLQTISKYIILRQFFLESKIVSILNLGENVFDEVTVPTAIIVIKNDVKFNKLRFADISKGSKYSGTISSIEFIEVDQSIYNTTPSNIFTDSIREKADDEELLETILEMKDGGFKYQRVNVGLSQKGKNDLAERRQRNLQAQLKTAQADTRPKFLIELAKPTQKKNCF
jgi:hypothetical protein